MILVCGERNEMTVTIKDVAKRARVAIGTVSRVINGFSDVDPRLQVRVEKAIKDLSYRPNARAQSLTRNFSPILSFILGNRSFLHPIHSRILHGVEEYCDEAGYLVIYTKFQYSPEIPSSELRLPRVLHSHGIAECMILAGTNYDNFVEALEKMRVPYVLLGNNFITENNRERLEQVRFDDFSGAREATEYLIQLGHRRIWYIGDTSKLWWKVMHEGYLRAMTDHGLEPLGQTVALSDDPYTNGYECIRLILEKNYPVTAIFGIDDVVLGAWDYLTKKGQEAPRDISLVGFDDLEPARLKVPPLTTVRIDNEEVGRQLAKMAIDKINFPGKRFSEVIVPTKLIKRGTCQPIE